MASTVAAPMPMAAGASRSAYTKTQMLGLVLHAAAPLLMVVYGLATGLSFMEDDGMFLLIVGLVALAAAAAVARLGMAGKIVGLVATVAAAGAVFWMAFGLMAPAAFGDFVPGVLVLLGVVLGLWGGIGGIRAQRAHRMQEAPAERRIMTVAAAIVVLAVVASGILSLTTRSTVDAAAAEGAVTATMERFTFAEGTYEVAAGEPAKIVVHNSTGFVHDFAVPELGIEPVVVNPGSEVLVEVNAPAGEYTIFCTLHSGRDGDNEASPDDMAATLVAK